MLPRAFFLSLALFLGLVSTTPAQSRNPLAPVPNWTELEQFQETITREEFTSLLDKVYAPGGAANGVIEITPEAAVIKTTLTPPATWTLRFAPDATSAKATPRFWREAAKMPAAPSGKPLTGVRIAIDPGHIGGAWAKMEERYFKIGESSPVMEGEMTLRVATLLTPKLKALGAEVLLLRTATEPVTPDRPDSLWEEARAELARQGVTAPRETYAPGETGPRSDSIQWQSEILFYRISEIRHRATIVNEQLHPDLTLCLHFNAEAWGDPAKPSFVPRNHLHAIINGCYSATELRNDDVRFDMLVKLLTRCLPEELAASNAVADALARASGLPPYTYNTNNAIRAGSSPYVWARNLLANRLYRTPVVFTEPYVMNSEEVWERVQAGDYDGEKIIAGQKRKSIYREYADGVAAGLRAYFEQTRPMSK